METFLKFHNIGSSINEYLEIGMPYMILYESCNMDNNTMLAIEYTESNNYYYKPSKDEINKFPERPLHNHDFYEFTIVLSGEIRLQIENETKTYKAGDCCLCNKNIHHKEFFDTNFEVVLFMFQEDYIKNLLNSDILYDTFGNPHSHNSLFHHLFENNDSNPFYTSKEYIDFLIKENFNPDDFNRIINSMIIEIAMGTSGKKYMMMGYFCRFIEFVESEKRYDIKIHQAKLDHNELLIYRISKLLEQYKGQIDNKKLADKLGYTSDHINRVIKKNIGKTLTEYKRFFILNSAAQMLRESDKNITEICEQLGYHNRTYFNKAFKELYGVTPIAYRNSELLISPKQEKSP